MGDSPPYVLTQRAGFSPPGGVGASAALVPSNAGRREITRSSEMQEHPEHVSLKPPWLLPSQNNLVTFNLPLLHAPEVS